jgi:hypothetical protein
VKFSDESERPTPPEVVRAAVRGQWADVAFFMQILMF